ncbi:hypothetical protein GCM10022631_13720 [Deinococcus rubellus]
MVVFIIVLASVIHPYVVRYDRTVVSVCAFLMILGLMLLPGWLFNRQQRLASKTAGPRIVKIWKSLPLFNGDQLFATRTGVGPRTGYKGFRTITVRDPDSVRSPPILVRDVFRYIGVLPVGAVLYLFSPTLLFWLFRHLSVALLSPFGYALLAFLQGLITVGLATLIAPAQHFRTASLLAVAVVFIFIPFAVINNERSSFFVLASVLGQIIGVSSVVFSFWWSEHNLRKARA